MVEESIGERESKKFVGLNTLRASRHVIMRIYLKAGLIEYACALLNYSARYAYFAIACVVRKVLMANYKSFGKEVQFKKYILAWSECRN